MHRFFVPPDWIQDNAVTITGPQVHQIDHVLRMRPGDELIVLDNSGWEIQTRLISVERDTIRAEVQRRRLAGGEPRTKISIYQGVLRSKKFEYVLQKCTELGVVEFVPIITERCVISNLDAVERKRDRWSWIIQEAAEQSRRGRLPLLRSSMLLAQACGRARQQGGLAMVPWEEEKSASLREILHNPPPGHERSWPPLTISLFIGPEGGFTVDEIDLSERYGLVPVTLGARIFRAETAGLVAATALLYDLGDME